jgi:erythromycin esterase
MKRTMAGLVLGCFLVGLAGPTPAGDDAAAVGEGARVAWLKKHVAPLRSIDPGDEDYSDLEPIRKALGDARIVFLSEELHGVGATFHARTRLIKFLHQKCGFDVLAFESGLYDCRKVWQLLREGKMPAREAISQGVFDIWASTEELQPMFQYLARQARQGRPLEVCGFDCQFSGPASRRFLPDDVNALLEKLPPDSLTGKQRETLVGAFKKLAKSGTGISGEEKDALAACRKVLVEGRPTESLPAAELAFWRQFLESSLGMAEVEDAYKTGVKTERNYLNLRDVQMARNLVWLARDAYPKRKILVWAAAFHLMRNPQSVAMVVEPGKTPAERKTVFGYAEAKIKTMGGEAWKDLEKEAYSIFFTAAEGEFQNLRMTKPEKLKPLIGGSLEDLLVKAGTENGFVDLRRRGADGRWLEERLVARVLGDMDHEADWTRVCDGIVFLRKQYGVTPARADLSAVTYQPVRDPKALGVPFDRYTTRDSLGRTITFYLSQPPKGSSDKRPVALFIQGAGCASVFAQRHGKVQDGLPGLLLAAGKDRFRVLVVEKPGVPFGFAPKDPASAEEGSAEFRREHTLPRWAEAVGAALRATHRLEDIDWTRTLAVGHSEGGVVAARLAADALVSHVAVLAGGGPTQLFDLVELAAQPRPSDRSAADARARVDAVHRGWAAVLADPDSADKRWLGHPHRRWSSFARTSTVEGLLASQAPVFAAHGTADKVVPAASFDVLRAELAARGRDLVALRLEGRDHDFRKADDTPADSRGLEEVFGRAAAWFAEKRSPIELAIQKDIERMQGTWRMVALNQEGEVQPLSGPLAQLQVVILGEQRTVQAGENVYAQARYRINPAADPPTIDVLVTRGSASGMTMLGIYQLNGNRLRVCLASHGRPRPRDFSPKAGSGHVLQELQRMSP